jgi:GNAT superfamily N-acetyltransferase
VADRDRLQEFLRATAAAPDRIVVHVPPFTAFLNDRDPLRYRNYAVPDHAGPFDTQQVDALRAAFTARDRLPRLEFVEEAAPDLARTLAAAGMQEELSTPLMTCEPEDLVAPPMPAADVAKKDLTPGDVRAAVDVQRVAFGQPRLDPAEDPGDQRVVLVRVDGEPAAAATWTPVIDGASEIAGVATAAPYRNRGLAGVVTAAATQAAFDAGATLAVLSPGGETAQRVYARAGFRRVATMLHWSDAPPTE